MKKGFFQKVSTEMASGQESWQNRGVHTVLCTASTGIWSVEWSSRKGLLRQTQGEYSQRRWTEWEGGRGIWMKELQDSILTIRTIVSICSNSSLLPAIKDSGMMIRWFCLKENDSSPSRSVQGFYAVYRNAFDSLANEDYDFIDDPSVRYPNFGDSTSDYDTVSLFTSPFPPMNRLFLQIVGPFYGFWSGFCTARSFVWLDQYDIRDAPNRFVLRQIEAENRKLREVGKAERNDQVRVGAVLMRMADKLTLFIAGIGCVHSKTRSSSEGLSTTTRGATGRVQAESRGEQKTTDSQKSTVSLWINELVLEKDTGYRPIFLHLKICFKRRHAYFSFKFQLKRAQDDIFGRNYVDSNWLAHRVKY